MSNHEQMIKLQEVLTKKIIASHGASAEMRDQYHSLRQIGKRNPEIECQILDP
jgi:hypothetical protein